MLTFETRVKERIPIDYLTEAGHGTKIADVVNDLEAGGETALFDAIKQAILAVDTAEGDENAIRAVVVLTDGRANSGATCLHDLVVMEANERPVTRYCGKETDNSVSTAGQTVTPEAIVGLKLALETRHDVQVFFIGVGDDADLNVGRILSQATGADLRGVTEDDLAKVLEEFSRYF
jgi:IMP cyclohydrolase